MKNHEIDAAWNYHNGTKHPNGVLLNRFHTYNSANRPIPYKNYKNADQIKIALDKQIGSVSALDAISDSTRYAGLGLVDINILARVLYFSCGITKILKFPPPLNEVEFRAASCTGALYHIETYLVCGNISGIEAGVYHFDPKSLSLTTLRKGDYRKVLVDATANESFVASAPVSLIFTDMFSRNSVKYQAREYRHAFWDCGTILANSLAMANAQKIPYRLILGFVDFKINLLLGLDTKKEAALAILSLDHINQTLLDSPSLHNAFELEQTENDIYFEAIDKMHESSSLTSNQEVLIWRKNIVHDISQPSSNHIKLENNINSDDKLEQVILRRGSTRKFSHEAISFGQMSTILNRSAGGYIADFEENNIINDIYIIANAVDGLEKGSYFYNKKYDSLELLQNGDLRDMSGHLGLDQNLPYDAAVTIFFMSDLQKILKCFGNRGYRVAQMDAAIAAGKMYLVAYALQIGATGLTFYDDEVTEFFSPHASNKNTMFMLAVGKKVKRVVP